MRISQAARLAWVLITTLALAGGTLLLASALLPFSPLKSLVDSLAADRQVETFTLARYQEIRPLAAAFGLVLLAVGILFIAARRRFQAWLMQLLDWFSKSG